MNFYRARIIVPLLVLVAHVVMAAGPLDPAGAGVLFEKQLNRSTDYPLSLFKTTNPIHNVVGANYKFFTARVISRLDGEGIPASDQAAVRNEICASFLIQQQLDTAVIPAQPFLMNQLPGAIGFYRHEDAVVAIHDVGLAGEPLEDVLRKLAVGHNIGLKNIVAQKYAAELVRLLDMAHRANIIWNVDSLSNFYVRPDGTLTGVDFSMAKKDAVPLNLDSPAKLQERKDFAAHVLWPMYQILFPPTSLLVDGPYDRFNQLGVVAPLRSTPANFTQANFIVIGAIFNPPIPYLPPIGTLNSVVRADHVPAVGAGATAAPNMGANTGFVLDAAVAQLFAARTPAWTNLTNLCNNW